MSPHVSSENLKYVIYRRKVYSMNESIGREKWMKKGKHRK